MFLIYLMKRRLLDKKAFALFPILCFTLTLMNSNAIARNFFSVEAQQKHHVVSGLITDAEGKALTGVSVFVKDKNTIGTTTDLNGRYSLAIPDLSITTTLVFSMVGYESQEILVSKQTEINLSLQEGDPVIDDVVVTAFGGTTRRTDMIGSVTSVKPGDLKIPSSNLTTALAGRVAGMIAYQRSGEPGLDNAEFFIRGVTTFGYKVDPLILIDNVEVTTTDLARLVPDDIASFSIMKDATATAIYGARGANGVILITTKQGVEGRAKLNFRIENSFSAPTRSVALADPITYMRLNNEAILTRDPAGAILYPQSKIDRTLAGDDPYLYPAIDWRKELIKNYTTNQRANLSVSGGGKVARYMVSGALSKDNGVLKVPNESNFNNNIDLKTYSLRANVNIDLTNTTELLVRLNGSFDDYVGPIDGGQNVYRDIMRTSPSLFAPYYPKGHNEQHVQHILFGNADEGKYLNPYANLVKGYKEHSRSMMLAQIELKQKLPFITEGLNFRGLINTTRNSYFDLSRQYNPFFYNMLGKDPFSGEYQYQILNEDAGTEYLDYKEGDKNINTIMYLESALNYDRVFDDKHAVSGLLVFLMRNRLNGNAGSLQLSLPFRNIGLSGRFTYSYDRRYFAEFNYGLNGSERFHKSNRIGFFPSFGLAWSVSNESFWEPYKDVISNFRIRGTYGVVGNDAIGRDQDRFMYLSEVNMNDSGRGAIFGTDRTNSKNGISMQRYANPAITWERSYKSNLAIEFGLFNKVEILADFFKEHRKNIFMARNDIPTTMGLAASINANIGEAEAKGIDLQMNYNHAFSSGAWLQGMANFTYATSKYLVYEEPAYAEPWLSKVGYSLKQEWGYVAERLFIDDDEVANSPSQIFGSQVVRGGDIKYRDLNGDGQITSLDRAPIGYPTTPEIVYGFGLSFGHKGFDVSTFFQGSARSSFWIDPYATSPFVNYRYDSEVSSGRHAGVLLQNQLLQAYADSHWSEENRDLYALWPRLSASNVSNNQQRNTWFMRNGAFLRLKQVEMGYTIPKHVFQKLKINSFRVYVNGTNLLTFSGFKLWDIEMAGNGLGYPIQRVFNVGINASF